MGVTVAVDVGGSGLRLRVAYADHVGPTRTAPGARIGATGIGVEALVADAVALVRQETDEPVDAVGWAMRGLLFLADRDAVLAEVQRGLRAERTAVVSDAVANLVGSLGGIRAGAVVAAGTGAVAFGSDFGDGPNAVWRRVDGWGHVLGDHGSAAGLGLAAMKAVVRALDGAGQATALEPELVELLGQPDAWPRAIMTRPDVPELLAGLAPAVSAVAEEGDPVAIRLCARAGHELATSLLAAARGLPDPVLTATGGLLSSPLVAQALSAGLAEAGAVLTPPLGGAIEGAAYLAAHLGAGEDVPVHPAYLFVG